MDNMQVILNELSEIKELVKSLKNELKERDQRIEKLEELLKVNEEKRNPEELSAMVKAIRNTEKLLGKISYDYNPKNRIFARSLFAVKDIKKGE